MLSKYGKEFGKYCAVHWRRAHRQETVKSLHVTEIGLSTDSAWATLAQDTCIPGDLDSLANLTKPNKKFQVKFQKRIFGPPCPSPPIGLILQKIRSNSEWPETMRNWKKNFAPWWPPQKKIQFFFKFFFKVVQNHLKRQENWKSQKNFFFSYDQKKLRKIFKKKFFQKFFESCSESSETWKKLKKKISLFSLYRSRT